MSRTTGPNIGLFVLTYFVLIYVLSSCRFQIWADCVCNNSELFENFQKNDVVYIQYVIMKEGNIINSIMHYALYTE